MSRRKFKRNDAIRRRNACMEPYAIVIKVIKGGGYIIKYPADIYDETHFLNNYQSRFYEKLKIRP